MGQLLWKSNRGTVEIHDPWLLDEVRQYLADIVAEVALPASEATPPPPPNGKRRGRPAGSKNKQLTDVASDTNVTSKRKTISDR